MLQIHIKVTAQANWYFAAYNELSLTSAINILMDIKLAQFWSQ